MTSLARLLMIATLLLVGSWATPAFAAELLGLWNLEENDATQRAVDSSANGMYGTYDSAIDTNVTGAPGRGLGVSLPGNDAITLSNHAPLQSLTTNFSVAAWINPATTTGRHRIMSGRGGAGGWGWGVHEDDLIFTTFGVRDYITSVNAVNANSWTHVAAVLAHNTTSNTHDVTFYVNGSAVQTISHSDPSSVTTGQFYVGSDVTGENWSGRLDEVAVWDGVLSSTDVQSVYANGVPTPKQAVFRYDYNSTDPLSDLNDDSGANNHGHANGSTSYSTDTPAGFPGGPLPGNKPRGTGDRSLQTAGGLGARTDQIGLVDLNRIANSGGLTLETWAKRTADTNAGGTEKILDVGGLYNLRITPGTDLLQFNQVGTGVTLGVGEWVHIVGVLDTLGNERDEDGNLSVVARFFVNGEQIGGDVPRTLLDSDNTQYLVTRPIGIGVHPTSNGEVFQGLLYDTRVTLGALSPGEFLLIPTPAALPAGALLMGLLAARRPRR